MPAAIPDEIRNRVIRQWFSGDTRAKIASDNNIGEGSVTNIVSDFNKGLAGSDFESLRKIAVESRKQGLTLCDLGPRLRLYNYIKKLGANGDQIESFIANCMNGANSLPPEKIIDLTNQLFDIAKSESIPPVDVPIYIKQKLEEKQRLEEQIQEVGAILEGKNVDIQTINKYNQLEAELKKHGLSTEDPHILLSILQNIRNLGYNPQKIVSEFSRIKSLRQTERRLKNNCNIFESRMARCQEVLPMSEQIVRLGIGIPELLALNTAVLKKADTENLPKGTAAYRVMEDIEDYNKLGGMKKRMNDVAMQIFTMNQISARQNNAILALFKLQSLGVTEDQILHLHKWVDRNTSLFDATVKDRML